MFDPSGPGAKQRAEMLKSVTKLVKGSVEGLAHDVKQIDGEDELGFLRVRTKKYEILVTPNDKYLLVVLQVSTLSFFLISVLEQGDGLTNDLSGNRIQMQPNSSLAPAPSLSHIDSALYTPSCPILSFRSAMSHSRLTTSRWSQCSPFCIAIRVRFSELSYELFCSNSMTKDLYPTPKPTTCQLCPFKHPSSSATLTLIVKMQHRNVVLILSSPIFHILQSIISDIVRLELDRHRLSCEINLLLHECA